MKLGSPDAMSKEPGGPADAPGHVGMTVEALESENERLMAELAEARKDKERLESYENYAAQEIDDMTKILRRSAETLRWLHDRHGAQSARLRAEEIDAALSK